MTKERIDWLRKNVADDLAIAANLTPYSEAFHECLDEITRLRSALTEIQNINQLTGMTFESQSFEVAEVTRKALEETK
jgi:hypothetical protein